VSWVPTQHISAALAGHAEIQRQDEERAARLFGDQQRNGCRERQEQDVQPGERGSEPGAPPKGRI
jgi:hypothetical protein